MKENPSQSMKTKIIFKFINESFKYNIKKIYFQNYEISINLKEKTCYTIEIEKIPDVDYRLFNCEFLYSNNSIINYCISIYFDNINIFYIDDDANNGCSIEIIFSNFHNKINDKNCYVNYKNKKFLSEEQFTLINDRRRINLLNFDINFIQFPQIINENDFYKLKEFKNVKNILVNIITNMNETQKLIGIYENIPFNDYNIDKKKLIEFLNDAMKESKNILKFDPHLSLTENLNNINLKENEKKILIDENMKSKNIIKEKDFINYFAIKHENLTEDDVEIFTLFSDFIILFPKYDQKYSKKKISLKKLKTIVKNYFIRKYMLYIFIKHLKNIDKIEKAKLIFSVSKVIKEFNIKSQINFQLIDFNIENTVYYEANQFNIRFIELLNENSEIYHFFIQLNSGCSKNFLSKEDLSSRISMVSLSQIKSHLLKTIPSYGIKANCDFLKFKALTISEVKINVFNEIFIFGHDMINDSEFDNDYNNRFVISNILKHENFGHVKFSLNDNCFRQEKANSELNIEPTSPIQFYFKFNNNIVNVKNPYIKEKKEGESGCAFDYFITRGNKDLYNFLKNNNANFEYLFKNVELMVAANLNEFCIKLMDIKNQTEEEEEEEEEKNDFEKNNVKYDIDSGKTKLKKKHRYIHDDSFPIVEIVNI